jgi:hypothetical protein
LSLHSLKTHRRLVLEEALAGRPGLDETLLPGDAGLDLEEGFEQGELASEDAGRVARPVHLGLRVAFLLVEPRDKPVEVRLGVVGFVELGLKL